MAGYFKIGLVSDDYLNIYDALNTSLSEKLTGPLPFTNTFHTRPVYYLSLEKSVALNRLLGLEYDNFIFYRIQSLFIFFFISIICGFITLGLSKRLSLAIVASLTVIIFPNNVNNICWTAARVDLLCCFFYIAALYTFISYLRVKSKTAFIACLIFFILSLMTKELAITFPVVVILFAYFTEGRTGISISSKLLATLFSVLIIYISFRLIISHGNLLEVTTLYQSFPLANAAGVIARSVIAFTIPLDYLSLNYALKNHNKIVVLYLLVLYGAIFYFIWSMFATNVYKYMMQILILAFVLIFPYIIIGYIRPQMILLPFAVITIYTLYVYSHQREFNVKMNKNILKLFFGIAMIFWTIWSISVISDWLTSYHKGKTSITNLINKNIAQDNRILVIGNPGRFKQTFMFDKLTGAYNYWKYGDFVIKDTINDIIQSAALDEEYIGTPFEVKTLSENEFEIKAVTPRQFFYIEGMDIEQNQSEFINSDFEVKFTEFNNTNKPIKFRLKILNDKIMCFLAEGLDFKQLR